MMRNQTALILTLLFSLASSSVHAEQQGEGKHFRDFTFLESLGVSFLDTVVSTIRYLDEIPGKDAAELQTRLKYKFAGRMFVFWKLKQENQLGQVADLQNNIESFPKNLDMARWKETDDPLRWLDPSLADLQRIPGVIWFPEYTVEDYKAELPEFRKYIESLEQE